MRKESHGGKRDSPYLEEKKKRQLCIWKETIELLKEDVRSGGRTLLAKRGKGRGKERKEEVPGERGGTISSKS